MLIVQYYDDILSGKQDIPIQIKADVRFCSHIISAKNGGVQTNLPPCQPKSEIDLPPLSENI